MNTEQMWNLVAALTALGKECALASENNGFWDHDPPNNDTVKIMLVVTELSEAVEGLRHGNPESDKIPGFNAAEEELADAIIRMADLWGRRGWRVPEAIVAKLTYNATRPYKHGKGF